MYLTKCGNTFFLLEIFIYCFRLYFIEKITVEFEEVKILDSEQNQDKIEQEDDEQSVNSNTDLDYNIDDDTYIENYTIGNVVIWSGIGILVIALISFAVISVIFLRKKH